MKRISTFLVVFCLSVLTYAQDLETTNSAEQSVRQLAQSELVFFLEAIPEGFEEEHGFYSRDEFANTKPGAVYTIMGMDADGNLFPTNMYQVAVMVNGENRSMLTVSSLNGVYTVEAVGASMLAKELQVIDNQSTNNDKVERLILNFYDLKCGFVAYKNSSVESLEMLNYKPLASAKEVLFTSQNSLRSGYQLSELRNVLR